MGRIKEFFHNQIVRPIRSDLEAEQMHYAREEWKSGKRSPATHSKAEWIALGKPNRKGTILKQE